MRFWIKFVSVGVIFGCCVVIAARVDPKLDFAEVAARVVEQKDSEEGGNAKSPTTNIRGVRVTVETKPDGKGSPESKSSESSDSSSSGDRTSTGIGVRTDVTFEISNETNETRSGEDIGGKRKGSKGNKDKKKNNDDDDDGDIPIIKGRTTPPKKGVNDVTTYRPLVRPIFPKSDGDDSFRRRDGPSNIPWTKTFPSSSVWTTERNYFGVYDNYDNNHNFNPSQPVGTHVPPHYHHKNHQHNVNPPQVQFYPYVIGQPTWESCRCDLLRPREYPSNIWTPTSSSSSGTNHNPNQYHYSVVVNDKLDEPFSVSTDRKRKDSRRRRESRES